MIPFLLVCGSVLAAEVPAGAWAKLPPHPRLFARPEKWESLKAQVVNDPVSQRLFALIKERAENVLTLPSLDLPSKGINLHGPMRQMQGRIAGLAMTYRLTGDARFLTRARQEMKELAETPHWRPGHFLSCSEATVAMAIGLDWLYDEVTPAERDVGVTAGAYSEGPDYWAYGTTFYALMAEALRTSLDATCDLERAPGFLQTADYTL